MFKNYVKIALRTLLRQKLYSVINVFGLSLGITCGILILLFIKNEVSYDSFYKNGSSMFSVLTKIRQPNGEFEYFARQPAALVSALREEFPEIRGLTFYRADGATITYGDKIFNERVTFTRADIIPMFDIEFVKGDPSSALKNPHDIVLSEAMAKKYFGDENPLGKQLRFETRRGGEDLFVVGVTKALPENSSLSGFSCLVDYTNHERYDRTGDNWKTLDGDIVVQLAAGTSAVAFQQKLPAFLQKSYGNLGKFWEQYKSGGFKYLSAEATAYQFELRPVSDIYFDAPNRGQLFLQGDPAYSSILGGIAMLVLVIACINFMILTIARSANRAKEVSTRT
ncbi:MAG: ABC transporter permease, partial [bacterium]